MSKYINYNGELVQSDIALLSAGNRAFCYGDGVFETIRCRNSEPLFFDKHYLRLRNALHHVKMELPASCTEEYFRIQINSLLQKNRFYKGARVRLNVFRSEGGLYTPTSRQAEFIITSTELENEFFEQNEKGLHIGIYEEMRKEINPLARFKTSSALLNVMASIWKTENDFNDCLLTNTAGHLIESLSSNLFCVIDNKLVTPAIESGCVDGTMRRTVIELAMKNNLPVAEVTALQKKHLLEADELFLTNAIQGITWVGAFGHKRYFHFVSTNLLRLLNQEVKSQLANSN